MARKWCYTPDGKTRLGPFTLEQMQELARSGQLKPNWMALPEDSPNWASAGTFPELFPPSPVPAPPPSAPARAEDLFDFDSQPDSPPAPPREKRSGESVWPKVQSALGSAGRAAWSVPAATVSEGRRRLSLLQLRRQLGRQQRDQEQFLADLGARLLAEDVRVPGCDDASQSYRYLSESHQSAQRAGRKGNKEKLREAARLADTLRTLSIDFARKALDSDVSFTGRSPELAQRNKLAAEINQLQQEIDERSKEWTTAPPEVKRRVAIGAAAMLLILLVAVWLLLPGRSGTTRQDKEVAHLKEKPVVKSSEKAAASDTPKTVQELFIQLKPAVPLIDTGNSTGSGFLVKHKGRYLVITNRHVVEDSPKGVAVHFPREKNSPPLVVPGAQTKVTAIHKSADLAVVDVNEYATAIERLGIQPVQLAPAGSPKVGDKVFAIGHPGNHAGMKGPAVLTSTLSDGIISAVVRPVEGANFLQVTAPINPGNSGGPLFDTRGRVVGVATLTYRHSTGDAIALEGLNFALQIEYVHEILQKRDASLGPKAIAAIVSPPPAEQTEAMKMALAAKLKQLAEEGYKALKEGEMPETRVFRLDGKDDRAMFLIEKGRYAVVAISDGANLEMAALDIRKEKVIARTPEPRTDPAVKFELSRDGLYPVVVRNRGDKTAVVSVTVLKK